MPASRPQIALAPLIGLLVLATVKTAQAEADPRQRELNIAWIMARVRGYGNVEDWKVSAARDILGRMLENMSPGRIQQLADKVNGIYVFPGANMEEGFNLPPGTLNPSSGRPFKSMGGLAAHEQGQLFVNGDDSASAMAHEMGHFVSATLDRKTKAQLRYAYITTRARHALGRPTGVAQPWKPEPNYALRNQGEFFAVATDLYWERYGQLAETLKAQNLRLDALLASIYGER